MYMYMYMYIKDFKSMKNTIFDNRFTYFLFYDYETLERKQKMKIPGMSLPMELRYETLIKV